MKNLSSGQLMAITGGCDTCPLSKILEGIPEEQRKIFLKDFFYNNPSNLSFGDFAEDWKLKLPV